MSPVLVCWGLSVRCVWQASWKYLPACAILLHVFVRARNICVRCSHFFRSHFGSRYTWGKCRPAGLFAWNDSPCSLFFCVGAGIGVVVVVAVVVVVG